MYSLNKHEIIDFIIFYLIYFMEYIIIRTKNYKKQGNTKMIIRKFSKTMLLATIASLLFTACSGPDEKVVKNIAVKYNIKQAEVSDVKIVKSYEDKGKTVFILEIKGIICEMPMIEIDKNWTATGISCKG